MSNSGKRHGQIITSQQAVNMGPRMMRYWKVRKVFFNIDAVFATLKARPKPTQKKGNENERV